MVFRLLDPCHTREFFALRDKADLSEWLGPSAQSDVQRLLQSRPPEHCDDIHQVTLEEIEKGFCSPLRTMLEMDDVYGPGGWRAVERF